MVVNVIKYPRIVTDYRLNANHNARNRAKLPDGIVTDYRLNANHNALVARSVEVAIVTDYRLNSVHEFI